MTDAYVNERARHDREDIQEIETQSQTASGRQAVDHHSPHAACPQRKDDLYHGRSRLPQAPCDSLNDRSFQAQLIRAVANNVNGVIMNSNLKWQATPERGTARNAKAIRQADAGTPAAGGYSSQTVRTANAPGVNAGSSKRDVNGNTISKD
jgi:hypothetical protein